MIDNCISKSFQLFFNDFDVIITYKFMYFRVVRYVSSEDTVNPKNLQQLLKKCNFLTAMRSVVVR